MANQQQTHRGFTLRSVSASLFGMIVMVVMLVFGESIEGSGWYYSMHILAVPAMTVFLAILLLVVLARVVFRANLLTRAEMVCVFFSLLVALPIMGMGFWTNYIWLSSTVPAQGDFEKIDAISDKMWPHGPNLLEQAWARPESQDLSTSGDVQWMQTEFEQGKSTVIPVLANDSETDVASVRTRVPLENEGNAWLTLGERYMVTVLARGHDMGAGSILSCLVYYDDSASFDVEAFTEPRPVEKPSFLHRTGFVRYGVYGVEFSPSVREAVNIEFRLTGKGKVELADPKLMNVAAFESLFVGRQVVSESEYAAMRVSERPAYIVAPCSAWTLKGAVRSLTGNIPLAAWRQPVMVWLAFISLLLTATFAMALIMRRQWVKNERYPLPLVRIPSALLGVDEDGQPLTMPSILKNRVMWLGFACCLFWCLMRLWHAYNPNVPSMDIDVRIKPYLDDPGWGRMWNDVSFSISATVLSLAIFMELNVLLSLVTGFFLFRSLHWLGEAYGWNIGTEGKFGIGQYPYGDEQMISAYIVYALLTLFFTRKYLWQALQAAVRGDRLRSCETADPQHGAPAEERELCSYRTAFGLLAAAVVGVGLWGWWVDVPVRAMLCLFTAMMLIGFVAMKLRAECGTPFAWFFPGTRLLVPLMGGMAFFGASGTMLASWTSLGMLLLFVIPGLQMEFIEVARRVRIRSRHVFLTMALGVVGGMTIGGWFMLSSMYGMGSNNVTFGYWFQARPWELNPYIEAQRIADAEVTAQLDPSAALPESGGGINPATWGYVGAAVATTAVTVLRQLFPGFWLHPIAVILGGTSDGLGMLMYWSVNLWGSLLAAWAIRFTVLKLGGANMVRTKLFPFFIGVFLAAMTAEIIFYGVNTFYYFFDISFVRPGVVF